MNHTEILKNTKYKLINYADTIDNAINLTTLEVNSTTLVGLLEILKRDIRATINNLDLYSEI